ncbi:MAG: phytoene desaturase family protein [Candidatus Woesearchaeota archaeon]
MKNAIVIGSGFGGLSAACYLAKDGYTVTLLEKNKDFGGRARVYKTKGFTFDMGPSWYLMHDVFEKFFTDFGRDWNDYYSLEKLNPSYKMIFSPVDHYDIPNNPKKTIEFFESVEKGAGKKLEKYLKNAKLQYDIGVQEFVYKNYNSLFDFMQWRLLKDGLRMQLFRSLDSYVKSQFKSPLLQKILMYTIVFLGGSPKKTPAMYSLMSHVDLTQGVFYPKGGMGSVVTGFLKLAKELGVTCIKSSPVKQIVTENGRVKGVQTEKCFYPADVVIANADYHHVDTQLLAKKDRKYSLAYWNKRTIAPSGFILYLGIKKRLRKLRHHTLVLAHDWEKHFDSIFEKPNWPKNPSYYICAPSKTDNVAPKGCENVFVLVPIASGIKDTPEIRKEYEEKILAHMEQQIGQKFQKDIIVKRSFALKDFAKDYNAYKGTALGLAHTLFQTAIFRPENKSSKVKGLYYTGHYTVPGVGVPMAIISGELAYRRVKYPPKG